MQNQASTYTLSFMLQAHVGSSQIYQLNVTIPKQLYEYYTVKDHSALTVDDFAKFVTPYALKPIADRLWQIYNNSEDFTNGVLMIVHQLTYQETGPEYYPVETIVSGKGDCDLFSFIAASILEAGGINTVLLYYKDQEHMSIGVELPNAPQDARSNVSFVRYQNVTYYIAECTGGQWSNGWRVGECPPEFDDDSAQVVTLGNIEQISIGQVTASLNQLDPSALTMQISPNLILENSPIILSGQVAPQLAGQNVTFEAKINNSPWTSIGTAETQSDGRFQYNWTPQTGGIVEIQASWRGNKQYNGSESTQANFVIIPLFLIVAIAAVLLALGLGAFAFSKKAIQKDADKERN